MSWDSFCRNVKQFANQAADEINQSADLASLQIKLTAAQKRAERAYATLGKLAYRRFSDKELADGEWNDAMADVASCEREISKRRAQIEKIKAEAEAARAAREAKKQSEGEEDKTEAES